MIAIFDEELIPHVHEYDVILYGMGINNSFSTGFANDIAINFPKVRKDENRESPYGDKRKYGDVYETECDGIRFCACYMHNGGYRKGKDGEEYVDYDALRSCIDKMSQKYRGKKIASPLIGSSAYDGNGDADRIMSLYEDAFKDCDIDLYLYDQKTLRDKIHAEIAELIERKKNGKVTKDEYDDALNRLYWKKDNGIFKEMPDGYKRKRKTFSWDDVITVRKENLEK